MRPPPDWNQADRAASFAAYAAWVNETARSTLLRDGTHVELFFIVLPDGEVGLGMPPPGMDRDQVAAMLRQSLSDNGAYDIVHVVEA